ncbi:hypothetical protein TNIN_92351 [Trichonephila inaurata madagascariensis]|uniref:Uncharacterized protein n=1 Tax=Trichonephila inaurata madagascariensis TaxID=2747483 RepID=A0A8X7C7G5_9ARAC|nr:hypothetical protein TNIN_92351 [Trichonephila inaurata madagascariensis]
MLCVVALERNSALRAVTKHRDDKYRKLLFLIRRTEGGHPAKTSRNTESDGHNVSSGQLNAKKIFGNSTKVAGVRLGCSNPAILNLWPTKPF